MVEKNQHTTIVFMGDYIDRGEHSPGGGDGLRVLLVLFKLKTLFPNNVWLLRGNHEGDYYRRQFNGRVDNVIADNLNDNFDATLELRSHLTDVLARLPVCALIGDRIFCVHGGIPRAWNEDESLRDLNVKTWTGPGVETVYDGSNTRRIDFCGELLWNMAGQDGVSENSLDQFNHGRGYYIGTDGYSEFFKANPTVAVMVSGHTHPKDGYCISKLAEGRNGYTILSTPALYGKAGGKGSSEGKMLIFHTGPECTPKAETVKYEKSKKSPYYIPQN